MFQRPNCRTKILSAQKIFGSHNAICFKHILFLFIFSFPEAREIHPLIWVLVFFFFQTCGNMWHFCRHRRLHRLHDWVHHNRAALLHVWCRPAYYSRQVSLPKLPYLSELSPKYSAFHFFMKMGKFAGIYSNTVKKVENNEIWMLKCVFLIFNIIFKWEMSSQVKKRLCLKSSLIYSDMLYFSRLQIFK